MAKRKNKRKGLYLFGFVDSLAAIIIIATVAFFVLIAFSYLLTVERWEIERPIEIKTVGSLYNY